MRGVVCEVVLGRWWFDNAAPVLRGAQAGGWVQVGLLVADICGEGVAARPPPSGAARSGTPP